VCRVPAHQEKEIHYEALKSVAMSDKTGKLYKNLTQIVFQLILAQKEFPNLKVERNIILQGITVPHQIDVYWKFELGGVPHETIVQTKDWNRPVEKGHILTFKSVLDDLPGQPKGIYVTKSGYQSGAKDFALAHGILLYELREADYPPSVAMTAGGWAVIKLIRMPVKGLITVGDPPGNAASTVVSLGFEFDIYTPKYTGINFEVSADWFKQEYPDFVLAPSGRFEFAGIAHHETKDASSTTRERT
jgi:restriction endonuclease